MTINTTSPNAVDYLKYAQAEGDSLLVYAADALAQLPVDGHPEIESAIDTVQSVLDAARHMLAEAAAAFCRDGSDLDTYADGRPVRTRLDLDPGNYYEHVWHPWIEHRINRRQEIAGAVTTTSGRRKHIVISAPGVLDAVDARPGLRLVTDDGSGQ